MLVTLGGDGSVLVSSGGTVIRQKTCPLPGGAGAKVVDETGAGDAFRAAFAGDEPLHTGPGAYNPVPIPSSTYPYLQFRSRRARTRPRPLKLLLLPVLSLYLAWGLYLHYLTGETLSPKLQTLAWLGPFRLSIYIFTEVGLNYRP